MATCEHCAGLRSLRIRLAWQIVGEIATGIGAGLISDMGGGLSNPIILVLVSMLFSAAILFTVGACRTSSEIGERFPVVRK